MKTKSTTVPIAQNQIRRSGPYSSNKIRRSGPLRGKTLEVEFLGEFESISETALDHESEDPLGTFGEITLDNNISRYSPFKNKKSLTTGNGAIRFATLAHHWIMVYIIVIDKILRSNSSSNDILPSCQAVVHTAVHRSTLTNYTTAINPSTISSSATSYIHDCA